MVKLFKVRYIGGKMPGFEHVMKEELAKVLAKRNQVEVLGPAVEKPKSKKAEKGKSEENQEAKE